MAKLALDLVTHGWEIPGWERAFYPEGLPEDWRLTYFANEFPAVLVPSGHWTRAGDAAIRAWSADVHENFRFYLEDPEAGSAPEVREGAVAALGTRFAGWVTAPGRASVPAGTRPCFEWRGEAGTSLPAGRLPAWRIPPALGDHLRAARAWLEALAAGSAGGRGLLLLRGEALGPDDLRRWWDLLRLLGSTLA